MKLKLIMVAVLLLVLSTIIPVRSQSPSSKDVKTAEAMLTGCRAVANAEIVGDGIKVPNDGLQCWGAFAVIQELTRWTDPSGAVMFSVCSPATGTESEMVAVFVKYVDDHPNMRHENFVDVALTALRTAFPCKPRQGLFK